MKIEGQKNNKPTIRNIAKLLMNSMYGRFGMHTDAIKSGIMSPGELKDLAQNYQILNILALGGMSLVAYTLSEGILNLTQSTDTKKMKKFIQGLPSNTNVAIAAAVTAYSRMIINQYKLLALDRGHK
jgi:hypothetical protein